MWRAIGWVFRRALRVAWETSVRLSGASVVTLWLEERYVMSLLRIPSSGQQGR